MRGTTLAISAIRASVAIARRLQCVIGSLAAQGSQEPRAKKTGTGEEAHRLAIGAIRRRSSKKLKMKTTLSSFAVV
jgi:hypothetical protein